MRLHVSYIVPKRTATVVDVKTIAQTLISSYRYNPNLMPTCLERYQDNRREPKGSYNAMPRRLEGYEYKQA